MIRVLRPLLLLVAMMSVGAALAQTAAPTTTENQEELSATVKQLADKQADIEKRIDVAHPSQAMLTQLGKEAAPLVTDAQAVVERLAPRVAAMKARLDQLGAKPEKGESADISKERETLEKTFADNDGLFKRAKVLVLKAQQDVSYVGKRQRALFTTSLFQRSTSLLNPPLWFAVVRETPGNIADVNRAFDQWLEAFNRGLTGSKLIAFWAVVSVVILLYWPLTWAARRFTEHEDKIAHPSRWQEILAAFWTAITVSGALIGIMYSVVYVFSFIDVQDAELAPLAVALQWGVIRLAVAAGLSRGLLSAKRSKWRLANVDDTTADKLIRIAIGVAIVVSAVHVFEALNEVVNASYEFSVAVRGIGALLVAAGLALALVDLGDTPEAENPDAEQTSPTQRRDVYGLVRGFAWTLILVISGSVLAGYIFFADFLVEQLTLVSAVGVVLYLLVQLVDEACMVGLQPTSRLGRSLIYTIGMRRETLEQLPVLLSGAARLLLFGIACLIVAAPWGMQSTDLSSNLTAAFFGFKVGDFTISLEGIIVALVCFVLVLAATRAVQSWLEDSYLPTTRLDSGLQNSINTSLGYVGFMLALTVSAGYLGLDFQKLAIVAGALSVGIGFGLQSIVNNFVSGLILLWERAVRVGDWVIVGSDQGYVRKINVRSTEIETFDRAAVIVPNSNLVSGVVKNLMRTDRIGRLQIELNVHASADPEKVREVLLDIAGDNDAVLTLPSPQVRFMNLTETAMTFDLFCYVADVESSARTKSDLYFEICKKFRQHGFFVAPPPDPTAINILGLDRLQEALTLLERHRSESRPVESPPADAPPIKVGPARPRKTG